MNDNNLSDLCDKNNQSKNDIVQYIVLRNDLKWPLGALITQCCHASTASIHQYYNDDITQIYLKNLNSMHKITLCAQNENDLMQLNNVLNENSIKFYLWIEQPENIPVCIATKPYERNDVSKFFKRFKLFK